jgi:hypothetical protein
MLYLQINNQTLSSSCSPNTYNSLQTCVKIRYSGPVTLFRIRTTLYAGGSGLFENSSGEWRVIDEGGNSDIRRIRGTGGNNIVIGGDGVLAHYNGSNWKKFLPYLNTSFAGIAVTKDLIVAVGMNMNMKAVIAMGKRIK